MKEKQLSNTWHKTAVQHRFHLFILQLFTVPGTVFSVTDTVRKTDRDPALMNLKVK